MSNEATKEQIRSWLENAVKEARKPDPRKKIKKERQQKRKKVVQRYGF